MISFDPELIESVDAWLVDQHAQDAAMQAIVGSGRPDFLAEVPDTGLLVRSEKSAPKLVGYYSIRNLLVIEEDLVVVIDGRDSQLGKIFGVIAKTEDVFDLIEGSGIDARVYRPPNETEPEQQP